MKVSVLTYSGLRKRSHVSQSLSGPGDSLTIQQQATMAEGSMQSYGRI